ncbi:MAG TPA: lysoplasmalogenase [Spirochaetota bacterium]|nr:lysoplasmalogenase [Spirochaetota bacterium]
MIKFIILFFYIFITGVFSVYCIFNKPKLFYFAKILPIIGLEVFLLFHIITGGGATLFSILVFIAVLIGMAGDIFIINAKTFVFGLVSFLITHIIYVVAFNQKSFAMNINNIVLALITLLSLAFVVFLTLVMVRGEDKPLIVPVWIYVVVITLMIISSIGFTQYGKFKIPLFILASASFYISDAVLAVKTFVSKKSEFLQIFILSFYYLAQTLFVIGAVGL